MSKAHMLVLGFLKEKPFHGYQIGQVVEQMHFPHGSGITLQAIYKAIQALQKTGRIAGTELREGSNPPKMVFHLNPKGQKYLKQLIVDFLSKAENPSPDWWLALHFSRQIFSKDELLDILTRRIAWFKDRSKPSKYDKLQEIGELREHLPFVHAYAEKLCKRQQQAELKTLNELVTAIRKGENDDFFIQ